ncbi:glycosyltransferase [Methanosarcina sp. DH1]|uniref:glycosyltransferase family 4 protein n=1 Tax=Methanosarcina sp. DH1 TaxID=2605695 RepID=UPI001E5B62BC|nr:glycosyltransferase family 4 protein [Methanosarcina sp. DH1]MCC4765376.1 glycosyltransferase [Methanosarcina sp. DH1]
MLIDEGAYMVIKRKSICVITFPPMKAGLTPLSNLIDILTSSFEEIHLITGNDGYNYFTNNKYIHLYGIFHSQGTGKINRIKNYIFTQLKIAHVLLNIIGKIDVCIFFLGGETLTLPLIPAKLFNKKTVIILSGYSIKYEKNTLSKIVAKLCTINLNLVDKIILYSPRLIDEWNLKKYSHKILIAPRHFLNFSNFKLNTEFTLRNDLIGYVGRLSEEKGILNFVKSIPLLLKQKPFLNILIIGDGDLKNNVKNYLSNNSLENNVKLVGWSSNEDLPKYLNLLKLLVIPSYTEGLPNVMLEAMACGTPVLATKVGAIPDIIKDEETGFLMENNSPECIAENIIRALEFPNLGNIATKSKKLVENNFTYEKAVERYSTIFNKI